jgi:hypothetical protein
MENIVDAGFLPFVTPEKGDFFSVVHEVGL